MKNYPIAATFCAIGLLLLLLNSCSLWDNPVDPQNIAENLIAPSDLIIEAVTENQYRLSWIDNCAIEEGFELDLRKNSEAWQAGIARLDKDETQYLHTFDDFLNETNYYFRVRAYNDRYYSAYSNTTMLQMLQVASPSFSHTSGTYHAEQTVSISCATQAAVIHYTTDGSTPTTSSQIYQNPIQITEETILKAKAFKEGWISSGESSAVYSFQVEEPVFSVPGGLYEEDQTVTISCATPEAAIYYTINGTEPGSGSILYASPVQVTHNITLKAKAFKTGWQDSQTVTASYIYDFVLVPGGSFIMGDTRGSGNSNELPIHSVSLNSFLMSKHEVTQAEWTAIMGSNPASGYGVGDNYPVYNVSWYATLKYCNLRSIAEGYTPVYSISGSTDPVVWGAVPTSNNSIWDAAICNWSANGYRLPTEAEWEYAARGATNTPDYLYSGSDDIMVVAWYAGNNIYNGSKPVGNKAHNGLGLHDMSGNVWEWCWDWYNSSYYSISPSDNPAGPANGSYRVLRGGGWSFSETVCTVSFRSFIDASFNGIHSGFRLCRTAP